MTNCIAKERKKRKKKLLGQRGEGMSEKRERGTGTYIFQVREVPNTFKLIYPQKAKA
jgi:hypothetical protein